MQDSNNIPPAEAAEFSRAFELHAELDEAMATAERLRAAADHTTGLEREANTRQAREADAEVARIQAALRGVELTEAPPSAAAGLPADLFTDDPEQTGKLSAAAPLSRQKHQELEILRTLRELGYDHMRLPRRPAGTPTAKAEARAKLPKLTPKMFDKAWERLRRYGEIAEVE